MEPGWSSQVDMWSIAFPNSSKGKHNEHDPEDSFALPVLCSDLNEEDRWGESCDTEQDRSLPEEIIVSTNKEILESDPDNQLFNSDESNKSAQFCEKIAKHAGELSDYFANCGNVHSIQSSEVCTNNDGSNKKCSDFFLENSSFECSTPKPISPTDPSFKYRINSHSIWNEEISSVCDENESESKLPTNENYKLKFHNVESSAYHCDAPQTDVFFSSQLVESKSKFSDPKTCSSSGSDFMDNVPLIDVHKDHIDSLLSIPSPNAKTVEPSWMTNDAITERNSASHVVPRAADSIFVYVDKSHKSRIPRPITNNQKNLHALSTSVNNSSSLHQSSRRYSINKSSSMYRSFSSECLQSSAGLTTPSSSLLSTTNSDKTSSQSHSSLGRLSRSAVAIEKSHHGVGGASPHRIGPAPMDRSCSVSLSSLNSSKRADYKHVKSKVRQYIRDVKVQRSRRSSPSGTSSPCPPSPASVFLLNEDLLDELESSLPPDLRAQVIELEESNGVAQLLRPLLRVFLKERQTRCDHERTLATLQLNYDNLLARHAHSQNLIDQLRIPCSKSRSYSTSPTFDQEMPKCVSVSQPDLIRATSVRVTDPHLGLTLDDSGSLRLLPTPMESNCSIPLNAADVANLPTNTNELSAPLSTAASFTQLLPSIINSDNYIGISSPPTLHAAQNVKNMNEKFLAINFTPSIHPHVADVTCRNLYAEMCDASRVRDSNRSRTPSGSDSCVEQLHRRLVDFAALLACDGITENETCQLWSQLLSEFDVVVRGARCQSQRDAVASLSTALEFVAKKFCLSNHKSEPPTRSVVYSQDSSNVVVNVVDNNCNVPNSTENSVPDFFSLILNDSAVCENSTDSIHVPVLKSIFPEDQDMCGITRKEMLSYQSSLGNVPSNSIEQKSENFSPTLHIEEENMNPFAIRNPKGFMHCEKNNEQLSSCSFEAVESSDVKDATTTASEGDSESGGLPSAGVGRVADAAPAGDNSRRGDGDSGCPVSDRSALLGLDDTLQSRVQNFATACKGNGNKMVTDIPDYKTKYLQYPNSAKKYILQNDILDYKLLRRQDKQFNLIDNINELNDSNDQKSSFPLSHEPRLTSLEMDILDRPYSKRKETGKLNLDQCSIMRRTWLRMQRDMEVLKRQLSARHLIESPKSIRGRNSKRSPLKAMVSYVSTSDTDSDIREIPAFNNKTSKVGSQSSPSLSRKFDIPGYRFSCTGVHERSRSLSNLQRSSVDNCAPWCSLPAVSVQRDPRRRRRSKSCPRPTHAREREGTCCQLQFEDTERNEILLGCTDLKRNRDRHGHSALRTISCHCEQEVCTHCTRGCRCMDNTKQCMWCSDALLHCLDAATLQASRVHDRSQSLLQALISCRRPWATKQTQ